MTSIVVLHEHGDRFVVRIRGHDLLVDQPRDAGGDDFGPTPTELFVAGLASCIGFFAERFLRRHSLPTDGLRVDCSYALGTDHPTRLTSIDLLVTLPDGFPEARREALGRVVERCTLHNSLRHPPEVLIALSAPVHPRGAQAIMLEPAPQTRPLERRSSA